MKILSGILHFKVTINWFLVEVGVINYIATIIVNKKKGWKIYDIDIIDRRC